MYYSFILRQRNFTFGKIYVELSRVTSFDGLYIVGVFSAKLVRVDPHALDEYERTPLARYLSIKCVDAPQSQPLPVALNIRSIKKHLIYFAYHERVRKSDLICLTET